MIIIRPIRRSDQEVFAEFSFEGLLGMTNLPRDRDKFLEKIICSEKSFAQEITVPGTEEYFFVLEDLTTERIGGTCGILAESRKSFRFSYHIEQLRARSTHFSASKGAKVLRLVENDGLSSEVCALYLQPTFRHSGLGRLLSLSRFLFIAGHLHRFKEKIVAEMRGYIDQRQISPFWEGIGHHFCNLSFVELMSLFELENHLLPEILPEYPIYISLLPKETQESIGKIHDSTKPAYQMLMHEYFSTTDEVDVFEGGPILSAPTTEIRAVKNSRLIRVDVTSNSLSDELEYILSNEKLDFRACFGKIKLESEAQGSINEEVATALKVKSGDWIRYVTVH